MVLLDDTIAVIVAAAIFGTLSAVVLFSMARRVRAQIARSRRGPSPEPIAEDQLTADRRRRERGEKRERRGSAGVRSAGPTTDD
jgi:hypothetical protein